MRAFITGATGFIGSHLTHLLVEQGISVGILKRPNSTLKRIHSLRDQLTLIEGDLIFAEQLTDALQAFQPDVIFHLGWYGVQSGNRNDRQQIEVNLSGTIALVEIARQIGCNSFVGVGSQAEYGTLSHKISEDAPTHPQTLYGTVKLCGNLLANQRLKDTNTRFVWLRVFSVYGPEDHPTTLISHLIRTLLSGKKPKMTLGEQLWDYLFVKDAVKAIYQTGIKQNANGVFNLASGEVVNIRYIAELIRDIIDPSLQLGLGEIAYRPDQIMHLQADISRLTQFTGWMPSTSLEAGLTQTIESMKHDSGTLK